MTMEVILSTAFGRSIDVQTSDGGELYKAADTLFSVLDPEQQGFGIRMIGLITCESVTICYILYNACEYIFTALQEHTTSRRYNYWYSHTLSTWLLTYPKASSTTLLTNLYSNIHTIYLLIEHLVYLIHFMISESRTYSLLFKLG